MMLPKCLTIAGSDSGGGAGIQGDLKTFMAHGVYGMSVLTALTAQNTKGVTAIHTPPAEFVRAQLAAVLDDIGCDAAKTGMLSNADVINAVCDEWGRRPSIPLVVDPVMVATTGAVLLEPEAIAVLKERLLPLALLATPNIHEAEHLTGMTIGTAVDCERAARMIRDMGPRAVLLKGGDVEIVPGMAVDYFCQESGIESWASPRLPSVNTHGSGCCLAAAIAAGVAKGLRLVDAVQDGRAFVHRAIAQAFPVGQGVLPVNHFAGKVE